MASGPSFRDALVGLRNPRVLAMLFLGFSAGLPILLIFSSLSLWLREAGLSKSSVTMFSWAALGYGFKFVWAPLVDYLPLPVLTRWLGRRRGWLLVSQFAVIAAIVSMALTDPAIGGNSLVLIALGAVALGFSSATQDIVIDAYRIESGTRRLQALMSSSYIAGYRVGMLVAGAGSLWLAQVFGSTADSYSYDAWSRTYLIMAAAMLVGIATTLIVSEPDHPDAARREKYSASDYLRFLLLFGCAVTAFIGIYWITADLASAAKNGLYEMLGNRALSNTAVETVRLLIAGAVALPVGWGLTVAGLVDRQMLNQTYIDPLLDFFRRYGTGIALLVLALIGCYRISDIVLGVISNVFYQDLGFDKSQIAVAVKTWGLIMTIAGGFLGGILALRYGVMRILFLGAVLSAATNLLFMLLATSGDNVSLLYLVIAADNLSAGIASAAFVAFLSALTNVSFTAMQYAIFSSIMLTFPKLLGGYSGAIVETIDYPAFFGLTALMGLPVLVLVVLAGRRLKFDQGAD